MSDKAFNVDVVCMMPVWVTAMECSLILDENGENPCSGVVYPMPEGGIGTADYLHKLGISTAVYGFTGGKTGKMLKDRYEISGIKTYLTDTKADTSYKTLVNYPDGKGAAYLYESLGNITVGEYFSLLKGLKSDEYEHDCVVLTGKCPKGLGEGMFADVIRSLNQRGIMTVSDFSGYELINAIKEKPSLIVCDYKDIGDITGRMVENYSDALSAIRSINNVYPSILCICGTKGAIFKKDGFFGMCQWRKSGKENPYMRSALTAGFIRAYEYSLGDADYSLKYACAVSQAVDKYGQLNDISVIKNYFAEMSLRIY